MAFETFPAPARFRMTEAEYERWMEGEGNFRELVDYELEEHDPVSLTHASLGVFFIHLLSSYLDPRPVGRCLSCQYPIRFRPGLRRSPDLIFVSSARSGHLRHTYVDGPADAAWEIVSPDSVERDWQRKLAEYERHGIPEYWIIDPLTQRAALYVLGPNGYTERPEEDGKLISSVIEGFWIRTEWLWQDPLPGALRCRREMGVLR